ncbi:MULTISPECIES: hypothetical protein [unclassified Streptomyces]|uniref:hypothetical protein n=1 Tax=unclassified Streptomyces TaxID=2593676 RepID=UPI0003603C6F|nr:MULTISPECIES: hypothetical protein [unclassified Streptomyces]MYQ78244.1 hypothetical protein [Streptomyces sp. SID4923]NEC04246.1 hypothetical protein [Streptomyces sp. SID7909]OKJ01722.1 hypothetical protein AMK18_09790 [Streptomyces sp. CB01249]
MSDDKKTKVTAPKPGTTGDIEPQDSHMTGEPKVKPLDSHMTGEPEIKPLDSHMTGPDPR